MTVVFFDNDRQFLDQLWQRCIELGPDAVAATIGIDAVSLQKTLTASKRPNPFLVFMVADAVGARLGLFESPDAAKMVARLEKRKTKRSVRAKATPRDVIVWEQTPDFKFWRSRRGGLAAAANQSPEARSASASRAAYRRAQAWSADQRKAHAIKMAKARWGNQMRAQSRAL